MGAVSRVWLVLLPGKGVSSNCSSIQVHPRVLIGTKFNCLSMGSLNAISGMSLLVTCTNPVTLPVCPKASTPQKTDLFSRQATGQGGSLRLCAPPLGISPGHGLVINILETRVLCRNPTRWTVGNYKANVEIYLSLLDMQLTILPFGAHALGPILQTKGLSASHSLV